LLTDLIVSNFIFLSYRLQTVHGNVIIYICNINNNENDGSSALMVIVFSWTSWWSWLDSWLEMFRISDRSITCSRYPV